MFTPLFLLAIAVLLLGIAPFTTRASTLLHVLAAILAGIVVFMTLMGSVHL